MIKKKELLEEIQNLQNQVVSINSALNDRLNVIESNILGQKEYFDNLLKGTEEAQRQELQLQLESFIGQLNALREAYSVVTPIKNVYVLSLSEAMKQLNTPDARDTIVDDFLNRLGVGNIYAIDTNKGIFLIRGKSLAEAKKSSEVKYLKEVLSCNIDGCKYVKARKDAKDLVLHGARLIDKDCVVHVLIG